jgi:malate dehydrogenase (oxaloacetate-decarboxylating)
MDAYDFLSKELLEFINPHNHHYTLKEALIDADVFIGVSAPRLVTSEMIQTMGKDPIVFALANPEPEISYEDALKGGARIIATGRSDLPNQINNVLVFPGLFRGALDCRATQITEEMKLAAAYGLASLIKEDELRFDYIIPSVFDPRVSEVVAFEVKKVATQTGIARK